MGFWVFMLVMSLLIPLGMTGFGVYFVKSGPKEINRGFGYRTSMSMKNRDTWQFAHRHCGRLWRIMGAALLVASLVFFLFLPGRDVDLVGIGGGILCAVQCVLLIGSIIPTEIALRKVFDGQGQRK